MTKDIKSLKEVATEISKDIKEVKSESTDKVSNDTMSEVAKELLALRNELEKLKIEKKSYSEAEKAAIEDARDEMLTDDDIGVLAVDEKYNEEGYTYRIVDSTRPGRIQQMIKRGYEIQYEDGAEIGANTVGKSTSLTSAVTVELGRTKPTLGIRMRIPTEQYNRRQRAKARKVAFDMESSVNESLSKSQFGEITLGNSKYSK